MKNCRRIFLLGMLLLLISVCFLPVSAAAKTVTANKNAKKCPQIKTGTTTITAGKCVEAKRPYVKFKAGKKGTYYFTLSGLTKKGKDTSLYEERGTVNFCKMDRYGYMETLEVEQPEDGQTAAIGKTQNVLICSQLSYNNGLQERGMYNHIPERTVAVELKKGETIYLGFQFVETCQIKVNVERFYFMQK